MIVAVGIHIVDLADFKKNLTDGFVSGVFLPDETSYAVSRARRHESFAGRFAAKKAVITALGVDENDRDLGLREVEVLRNSGSGEVGIRLHGRLAALAEQKHVGDMRVSISHCGTNAVAIVVLSAAQNGRGSLEQHRKL
ncbi:MAG: holo-ACP synthase [Candidatus Fermentibacteraceae bacterium]